MQSFMKKEIQKTRLIMMQMEEDEALLSVAEQISQKCISALQKGCKIIFAGNGGSAADSQHLAAELVSRFSYDRPALAAIALTTDTSALTAIGNDYAFENLFARQVEAIGQTGDVFIGISTSGKSPNILRALDVARSKDLTCIGFTGQAAPLMAERCEFLLTVPSTETPKIQECHIMMGHVICALIEETLFGELYNPKRKAKAAV